MSHFYGSVQGNGAMATRGGTKGSGYDSTVASHEGSVRLRAYYNEEEKADYVQVELAPWQGSGSCIELYDGPISGSGYEGTK